MSRRSFEQSRQALTGCSNPWVNRACVIVPALVLLYSMKKVTEGPVQRVQNQRSIHLIVPQPPNSQEKSRTMGGGWWLERAAGGQFDFKGQGTSSPECSPASEGGGCALRSPCCRAALGQSGREPRESSGAWRRKNSPCNVCVLQIHKRKALLKFAEPLLKFE